MINFCHNNSILVEGYSLLRPYLQSSKYQNLSGEEIKIVDQIAISHNKTPAQIILRYALEKNLIIFPNSQTPKRISENFDIFDFKLSENEIKELSNMDNAPEFQRMDEASSGDWDHFLDNPLDFECHFKTVQGQKVNDDNYKF